MTTLAPSEYSPTGNRQFFIGPQRNSTIIQGAGYGASLGITYCAAYITYGDFYDWRENILEYDERNSQFSINKLKLYQDSLPRKNMLGMRPGFLETNWVYYAFEDGMTYAPQTTNKNFLGVSNDNFYYIGRTGYIETAWPIKGVCNSSYFMNSFMDNLIANGITLDFLLMDVEYSYFGWVYDDVAFRNYFTGLTQYSTQYFGLSSWNDLINYYGGNTTSSWNWNKVSTTYTAKVWNEYFGKSFLEKYPKSIFANYNYYRGERIRSDEAIEENGQYWPQGDYVGNAGSPVLYGSVRQLSSEMTVGSAEIRYDDPTRFYAGYERSTIPNFLQNYEVCRAASPLQAPITSFLLGMTELRTAKRNAPDKPLAPWINTINVIGYYPVGHLAGREYRIGSIAQPVSISLNIAQSPAEVLHNSWYNNNISSLQRGFTNYDGSTSGFRLRTPVLNLMENVWYKQNIASLTFDGSTTAFEIKTSGTTGTTAALAYYYNNISAGTTYIFSYFVDMDRGFTGLNGRFTNWATSETSTSAPSLTTTTGITFEQILPVTGGQVYIQSPVSYNIGDSGWTKVAWRFVGTSNPRVAVHAYHAGNRISSGHTAYIKDIALEIEGVSSNTAVNINSIGSTATASNALTSLEYYYNGLTPGTTYIFSYYTDNSNGYTGSKRVQKLHNFVTLLYDAPIGITYNQTSPVTVNSLYHTAGISYGSTAGWNKMSWEFSVSLGDTYDPLNTETVSASVACVNNIYSVMDSVNTLSGVTLFISSPSLEIKSSPSNIPISVVEFDYETIPLWQWGPPVGWSDAVQGPNRDRIVYLMNRGGNSAYFYEIVRHACLLGTKGFGSYNPEDFLNGSVTGSMTEFTKNISFGQAAALYRASGLTQHERALKLLDSTIQDVHDKIGGHTLTTAITERVNWRAPYIANGAPDVTGNTWWWRVTALDGHTVYCQGVTLSSKTQQVGTWVATSGPTLANVDITWQKWGPPIQEPNMGSPAKEFNFVGMTNLNQLLAIGCTFSRGSSGSYLDSSGTVIEVGPNQPRFTHSRIDFEPQGLLLEGSVTNLLNWSETFASSGGSHNNWADTNISRTVGSTAPNGITSSIRFTATGANATIISSSAIGSSARRAFSCWIRGITGIESLSYTVNGGSSWTGIGGISSTWKRLGIDYSNTNHTVGFRLGNTLDSVELWGVQLEDSSTNYNMTSYIKTTSSRVTRSADYCAISGSSFSSWYGNTYGTFVIEWANGNNAQILSLRKDASNYFGLSIGQSGEGFGSFYGINGQVGTANQGYIWGFLTKFLCPELIHKVAMTYSPRGHKFMSYRGYSNFPNAGKSDYFKMWPGNTVGPPPATEMIFSNVNNTASIKNIRYWPFVFDQKNLLQMVRGGVDPSLGYIGRWDSQ